MAFKIKEKPEDFVVEEITNIRTKKKGEYTYFILKKENWTSVRAIDKISKACGVSKKRFGFAGAKDKQAITKQLVSAWNVSKEKLESVRLKDIEIKVKGYGDSPITLGDLIGNKFIIKVISVKNVKRVSSYKFPNYFGEQRFGSAKNSHEIGKAILKGELETVIKLFLLSSVGNSESDAAIEFAKKNWGKWKSILGKYPKFLSPEKAILNWLVSHPTDFGGSFRVLNKKLRTLMVNAYSSYLFNEGLNYAIKKGLKKDIDLDIVGYNTKLSNDDYSTRVKQLMNKDGTVLEDFRCRRMPELKAEGTTRSAFVKANNIKIKKDKKHMIISFELQKGSYATVFLKHFLEEQR